MWCCADGQAGFIVIYLNICNLGFKFRIFNLFNDLGGFLFLYFCLSV